MKGDDHMILSTTELSKIMGYKINIQSLYFCILANNY